ncbi:MAG: hypothetical protein ABIP20_14555, partial [Chthoniobacteraceae bacterium]
TCVVVIVGATFAPAGCILVRAPLAVARAPVKIYQGVRRHQDRIDAKKWREEQSAEKNAAANQGREIDSAQRERPVPPPTLPPQ